MICLGTQDRISGTEGETMTTWNFTISPVVVSMVTSRPTSPLASTPVEKLYQRGSPVKSSSSPAIVILKKKYSLHCTPVKNGWSRWKKLERHHPRWKFQSPPGYLAGMYISATVGNDQCSGMSKWQTRRQNFPLFSGWWKPDVISKGKGEMQRNILVQWPGRLWTFYPAKTSPGMKFYKCSPG